LWLAAVVAALLVAALACGGSDATPTPSFPETFADIPGIVDPEDFEWPRVVETSSGRVEIPVPPQRVYSLSLGHAEILAALVGADKLVAVVNFFKDPATSAMWEEFSIRPEAGSDPEEIVALQPDLVIASAFTSAETTDQLTALGIKVVRAELESSALGNIPNIMLLGYMLGAEEEALELTNEMRNRVEAVSERVDEEDPEAPRVLAISRYVDIYAAGAGTTEGGIIETAGGINAAAESGIESHQQVSIESIASINPAIILLTQPEDSAAAFAQELYANPALTEVPAIRDRKVLYADPTYYTTLSHWNVRGIEEAAKVFFPDLCGSVEFEDFGSQ
jgi:iron complex transport system substrate-binding protein